MGNETDKDRIEVDHVIEREPLAPAKSKQAIANLDARTQFRFCNSYVDSKVRQYLQK